MEQSISVCIKAAVIAAVFGLGASAQAQESAYTTTRADGASETYRFQDRTGRWGGGGGAGILWNTPDGEAFTLQGSMDYFVQDQVSIGPMLQLGFTGDLNLFMLTGQGKYWLDLDEEGRGRLFLQGGLGIAHADIRRDDTALLIPLGVGIDYAVNPDVNLTSSFLLNFTSLDPGGEDTEVMPGLLFGLAF
jgi:hypothetical protein